MNFVNKMNYDCDDLKSYFPGMKSIKYNPQDIYSMKQNVWAKQTSKKKERD